MVKSGNYAYISTNKKLSVINIVGTYECTVDVKGRILLPVALKKQLNKIAVEEKLEWDKKTSFTILT